MQMQEYVEFWKVNFNEAERLRDYDRGIHLLVLLKEVCVEQIAKMEVAKSGEQQKD